MKLSIAGLHMEVGDSLRTHCEEVLRNQVKKYFDNILDVEIAFSQEGHEHISDISIHVNGIHLRAEGKGADFFAAVDDAASKLARQLTRYKGRMQKHRKRRMENAERFLEKEVIKATHNTIDESALEEAPESVDEMFGEYMPKIIKKDVRNIQTLTVDEAVMQMDLLHTNLFIFQNPKTQSLNIVYREHEGATVGWIEPGA